MKDEIKKLIADRKARLSAFIFGESFKRIKGERKELADVTEAVIDNAETDEECLNKFDMVFVSGIAEIMDGWYRNDQGEVLIF